MTQSELVCELDGESTLLTCAECGKPICPKCLVRTPVGMKCTTCGAGARRPTTGSRRAAWMVPVLLIVVVFSLVIVPRLLSEGDVPGVEAGTPEVIPNPEFPARYARIGMEARDGDLAFTVASFDCGANRVEGGSAVRTAQGQFCFVSLDVKNNGRTPATFVARAQTLGDGQSRQFGPDLAATAAHPANTGRDLTSVVVNPGNEFQGVLVFDVAPGATPDVANLHADSRGPGAFVNLRPPS